MNAGASADAFDAIIIGTGQAGPALAGRLTAAGRRPQAADHRTRPFWRDLCQHWLHTHEDHGR